MFTEMIGVTHGPQQTPGKGIRLTDIIYGSTNDRSAT